MITRLSAYDFDGTLMQSPEKEEGKKEWFEKTGELYPHEGWWGRKESLDLNVFDIQPFQSVLDKLRKDLATPNTYVIILTSRQEKLRPFVQTILNKHNINVHKLDMKNGWKNKGQKILDYIQEFPDLKEINVYDDMDDKIAELKSIEKDIPDHIEYNIHKADNGRTELQEAHFRLLNIIDEEIKRFDNYLYHGTSIGAVLSIKRDGKMKLNQALGSRPNSPDSFLSFSSKPDVAEYYAKMKGGGRGVVLRTIKTNNFKPSPKYNKNDGYEWITTKEIPTNNLEIKTVSGWIPLSKWYLQ